MDIFEDYLKKTIDYYRRSIETTEKKIEELTDQLNELSKVFDPLDLKGTKYKTGLIESRMWMLTGSNTEMRGALSRFEGLESFYKMTKEEVVEE